MTSWWVRITLVAAVILIVCGNVVWYVEAPGRITNATFASQRLDPEHPCAQICAATVLETLALEWSFRRIKGVVPADALRRTSMAELIEGLEKLGIAARGVQLPTWALDRLSGPVILFVDDSHFLVVLTTNSKTVAIVDPPDISRLATTSDLEQRWKGQAVLVARTREELARLQAELGIRE